MSQYEQENDLGRGGGEVDGETLDEAWEEADRRLGDQEPEDGGADEQPQPWAKALPGDDDA